MSNFRQGFTCKPRSARKAANLTQREMAEKLGITCSSYIYYEAGRIQPTLECLAKICQILGVSADFLLGLC
ncbi:MAG: helix-turn-helix transcriptional regulator [Acutalibacter sp.]|jgi:transcriptional regulator with XRE-family HTH domain|uniref:helix-turn-helix domain-containing protein n=1 Tax=Acutalibacter sp. TaxID=1918636 RepID=UPI0021726A74|nr:helix-turn-helix transcriptional regulator [Acutalibacter sp.]MCI9223864.1 helix-turn-helix transcriptional regulator [Acutalibacter sp.]